MEENNPIQQTTPARPQLLTILCILTFIGSGLSSFSYLAFTVYFKDMQEILNIYYANMPEVNYFQQAPQAFFLFSTILSAASLLGAILMWNLRKAGFHIYTVAQLLNLVLPSIYISVELNPLLNIMITALFVYLYARNLRFMR